METHEEWRVVGYPEPGYPEYDYTWGSKYSPSGSPEENAKTFINLCDDWVDGPHLYHRTVTTTEWRKDEKWSIEMDDCLVFPLSVRFLAWFQRETNSGLTKAEERYLARRYHKMVGYKTPRRWF